MKPTGAQLGSLGAALLASACCLGPLALGAIGLGSVGVGAVLAPYRPWFLAATAVLLAIAFWFAYRPLRETDCGPDGVCVKPASRTGQRITLWIVALATVALATYPDWRGRLPAAKSVTTSTADPTRLEALSADGAALRDRFNADRDHTRLVMLLSPS